jgi:hypothetical protein
MKERIYIKVDELQLIGLEKDKLRSKRAWGMLNVGQNGFKIGPIVFTLGEEDQITQSYTSAHMRLLDTSIAHHVHQKNSRRVLLSSELIEKAVHDEYLISRKNEIKAFIQESNLTEKKDFPFFRPFNWKKSLRIPVDFIRLSRFYRQKNREEIFAHARIGHHLLFYDIQIWDPKGFRCQTQEIKDRRILYAINDLLDKEEMKQFLKSLTTFDHDAVFIDKVLGCNPEAPPPPIRFY